MTNKIQAFRPAATLPVQCLNAGGAGPVVLVCEHASNHVPEDYDGLGLSPDARQSHVAWDPGAMGVARGMSTRLNAPLVAGTWSRLIYDCNRPPEAGDAMPATTELFAIPGNTGLSDADKAHRVETCYIPFRDKLTDVLTKAPHLTVLVTIHSFTPVYRGARRRVEIGILHDTDSRLADAMLDCAPRHTDHIVERNAPYGPEDGVTHTLKLHGLSRGLLNVMLEIRSDLIETDAQQGAMAEMLSDLVNDALAHLSTTNTSGALS